MTRWAFIGLLLAACAPARPSVAPSPVPTASAISRDASRPLAVAPAAAAPDTSPGPAASAPPRTYRRTGSAAVIGLTFTGDINLGNSLQDDGVPPDSGRGLLAPVVPLLAGDLVIGNLEGALSDTLPPVKCGPQERHCYTFRTPLFLAARLRDAGFTHLNLANNHALDLGPEGRASTERVLDSLDITHYGPLGEIAFDTLQAGDSLRVVALIGFTTYPGTYDLLDTLRSRAVVDSVRKLADIVLVTFHGGTEGDRAIHTGTGMERLGREKRGDLRTWAHAMVDAGADAVVGHGPHVLRGIEFWRGRPIVYSMGNFLTYRGFSLKGYKGITALLHLELDPHGRFLAGRLIPLHQALRQGPRPDPTDAAISLVRRMTAQDFPRTGAVIAMDGAIFPPPIRGAARRHRR
ncbi:MAG TPA: CapA family protein [Gemmatimonadales bacterium]|nr:CapA family protein [Gemmatimonadales bacterium]